MPTKQTKRTSGEERTPGSFEAHAVRRIEEIETKARRCEYAIWRRARVRVAHTL